ncbi:MAG: ChbG/HpnK family deacetylase [Bacteroidales bacterium]|nr:ChbG/HpnK family deacetylase [Bacteroidales bacterium]
MSKIFIHSDDFGLSKNISDNILDCHDYGILNSTSIIVNGSAFEYSMSEFVKRQDSLRLCLHLNLVEGKPLSSQVSILTNSQGEFKYSFQTLWLKYLLSNKDLKTQLKIAVELEIKAQIQKYLTLLPKDYPLNIDGHIHIHVIPFIFDIICKQASKICYIRVPLEPFFFSTKGFYNYLTPNTLKHIILKILSKRCNRILKQESRIKKNDYLIGILFSGRMSLESIKSALKKIKNTTKNPDTVIEVLFHSGYETAKENIAWTSSTKYIYASLHKNRIIEKKIICSNGFKELFQN